MNTTNTVDLRGRLREVAATMSMRDVAVGIGVSYFTVWKFLKGRNVRPSTLAKITAWVADPDEIHAAGALRIALRRVIGRLGYKEKLRVEREVGDVVRAAYKRAPFKLVQPSWVRAFGKHQSDAKEPLMEAKLRRSARYGRVATGSSD